MVQTDNEVRDRRKKTQINISIFEVILDASRFDNVKKYMIDKRYKRTELEISHLYWINKQ